MARRQIFDISGSVYFLTTTIIDFTKIFSLNDKYYDILIENLKFYLAKYQSALLAYVLMPHHIHLINYIPKNKNVSDFMRDFKKYTSVSIKEELLKDNFPKIMENLTRLSETGRYKLWMDRFDSVIIENGNVLETKINYIHYNPVRAGLVKEMNDWKYSSARNYYLDDNSVIEVSTNWTF